METIDIRQIQRGYWTLTVGGIDRPVVIVRQGRRWHVQSAEMSRPILGRFNEYHGSTRTLRDARSLANAVWIKIDAQRELARHEALEHELSRWLRLSRKVGVTVPMPKDETPIAEQLATVRAKVEDTLRVCRIRVSADALMRAHGIN